MNAKIFNVLPNLEKVCSAAAQISQQEGICSKVYESITDLESARKTLDRILKLGHVSVLEHGYFNIMFENVSLFFEQFLIEHRLSAYTIKSGRYVNFENAGCYEPEFRYKKEVSAKTKKEVEDKYIKFVTKSFEIYKTFSAAEIKVEDARFVLPYSLKTNIFCSMDAEELIHLIAALIYCRGRKYPELVELGNSLKQQLDEVPNSYLETPVAANLQAE
jgi:thymidylate synthase (FAD)